MSPYIAPFFPLRNEYDAEGNRTLRYKDLDTSEDLSSGDEDITKYEWDYRNRLAEVKHWDTWTAYDGGNGTPDQDVKYSYDVFDRWIGETIAVPGETTLQTRYVYDGTQIIAQFDKTGTGDVAATDLSHRYLWGPAVDQILADEQVHYDSQQEQFVTDELLWTLTDHQNTVRDLATYDSINDATTIANHLVFDAFGRLTSGTNPCLFGYTARPFSESTNSQQNGGRWYDAIVGRWLSPDNVWDGVNLYRYVGNGPTNATDPTGCLTDDARRLLSSVHAVESQNLIGDIIVKHIIWKSLKLANGDAAGALALVKEIREAGKVAWDNDDWASADHYLNSLTAKQMSGVWGSVGSSVWNCIYSGVKAVGIPVPRDNPNIPPCPQSWRQWWWGDSGAW